MSAYTPENAVTVQVSCAGVFQTGVFSASIASKRSSGSGHFLAVK